MNLRIVRILGWLVIAHGLSHAVLPMRGFLGHTGWDGDLMPTALYGGSMVAFVAAGLGLLGVRPLDRAISPLIVVASAWSLVAIFVLNDPGLWFGAVCDVALLPLALWRAYAGWPSRASHRRIWHVAAATAGFTLLAYVGVAAFTFPTHRTWGSTRAELTMPLPGDAESRDGSLEVQHAVTIDAPAEDVWPSLVGLGEDPAWTVATVTPERALVVEERGSFVLQPITDERTRFIIRSQAGDRHGSVWTSAANLLAYQLPHFISERRMMLSIKALAEERYAKRDPVRTIDIVATDDMKYSLTSITAEPGEEIRIRLAAKGVIPKVAMAHNVVVLKIETDIAALLKEGAPFRDTDFIPPTMMEQVIAKTALAGPGEIVQVTFNVPETPGDYPFLCTFAGHYQAGMKGTLLVQ